MRQRRNEDTRLRRAKLKTRAVDAEGEGAFEAYVSVFDTVYSIGWGWEEKILKGAFAESLAAQPVQPVMWDHAWEFGPIGDATGEEDDKGLKETGALYLGSDLVDRVWKGMTAEAINEWSIAFYVEELTWSDEEPELDVIVKADLVEVTACLRGANPDTETTDLRSVWVPAGSKAEVARLRSLRAREFGQPEPDPKIDPPAPPISDVDLDAAFAAMADPACRAALREFHPSSASAS